MCIWLEIQCMMLYDSQLTPPKGSRTSLGGTNYDRSNISSQPYIALTTPTTLKTLRISFVPSRIPDNK